MTVRVRIDSKCEETLWGLSAHLEDALFIAVLAVMGLGVLLLMKYSR